MRHKYHRCWGPHLNDWTSRQSDWLGSVLPLLLEPASGWLSSQGGLSIWDSEGRLKPVLGALWVRGTKCGLVQPGL